MSGSQPEVERVAGRAFARAAAGYADFAVVPDLLFDRLLQRLDTLAISPESVLELGCGQVRKLDVLKKRYRNAHLFGIDLSPQMLGKVNRRRSSMLPAWLFPDEISLAVADAARLPLADDSVDLVLCNMMLPWCSNPALIFAEIFRVLTPGGAVFWSSAGPDTLQEYRNIWRQLDQHEHCFGLLDMHDLGDDMLAAGFDAPVLDRENLLVSYPSVSALEAELRGIGAANIAVGRRRGLMSPRLPEQLRLQHPQAIEVTLELVQGHGWKGELARGSLSKPASIPGEYRVSLQQMRDGLGQRDTDSTSKKSGRTNTRLLHNKKRGKESE